MKNKIIIRGIISLFIGVILIGCNTSGHKGASGPDKPFKVHVDTVAGQLIEAGLFSITDTAFLDSAKQELINSYVRYDYFSGYTYPDSLRYVDYRFYFIDSEELFEIGGLTKYLDLITPTFDRLELELAYSNEKSTENENHWKHTIEINGNEYIAFEGSMDSYDLWDQAYLNFIEILNDQLKLQGSEEQFYPIRSGNDGMIVMLTREQFEIVKKYYPDDGDHPKEIDDWRGEGRTML